MKVRWFFVLSTILIALGIVADRAEELLGGSYSRFTEVGSPLRMDDPTGNPEVIDQTPVSEEIANARKFSIRRGTGKLLCL